jgi:hypothetical protein
MMRTLAEVKAASRWLSAFAQNVHSQAGEDGILAKALSLLPDRNHWCIEFGAWDGRHLSNTFNLVERHGYHVVLIEGDRHKYAQLRSAYPHGDRAIFINTYVGWSSRDGLDQILRGHAVPEDPDLLTIDVDGNDYHIWRALERTRPKLILIEYNPTMANSVEFIQPADPGCNQGSSPGALVILGKKKGYELIAITRLNLLFVDEKYYELFQVPDNTLEALRDDPPDHIFCGYDGTVFLYGAVGARWHRMWLSEGDVQVLPRMLRGYPPTYSRLRNFAFACWRALRDPGSVGGSTPESNQMAEARRRAESQAWARRAGENPAE